MSAGDEVVRRRGGERRVEHLDDHELDFHLLRQDTLNIDRGGLPVPHSLVALGEPCEVCGELHKDAVLLHLSLIHI